MGLESIIIYAIAIPVITPLALYVNVTVLFPLIVEPVSKALKSAALISPVPPRKGSSAAKPLQSLSVSLLIATLATAMVPAPFVSVTVAFPPDSPVKYAV